MGKVLKTKLKHFKRRMLRLRLFPPGHFSTYFKVICIFKTEYSFGSAPGTRLSLGLKNFLGSD